MAENNGEIRHNGRFAPGNPGKPKGAVTKVSVKVKESIFKFLEKNTEDIQDSYDKLKPAEKLRFIADIIPYAVPKLSSVQTEIQGEIVGKWEVTLNLNGATPNQIHKALGAGIPETDNWFA